MERDIFLYTGELKLTSLTFFFLQNQFILENIIDVERTYNFPIEIEVHFACSAVFYFAFVLYS